MNEQQLYPELENRAKPTNLYEEKIEQAIKNCFAMNKVRLEINEKILDNNKN